MLAHTRNDLAKPGFVVISMSCTAILLCLLDNFVRLVMSLDAPAGDAGSLSQGLIDFVVLNAAFNVLELAKW